MVLHGDHEDMIERRHRGRGSQDQRARDRRDRYDCSRHQNWQTPSADYLCEFHSNSSLLPIAEMRLSREFARASQSIDGHPYRRPAKPPTNGSQDGVRNITYAIQATPGVLPALDARRARRHGGRMRTACAKLAASSSKWRASREPRTFYGSFLSSGSSPGGKPSVVDSSASFAGKVRLRKSR